MDLTNSIIIFVLGLLVGGLISYLRWGQKDQGQQIEFLNKELQRWQDRHGELQQQILVLTADNSSLEQKIENAEEKLNNLKEVKEKLSSEFKILANQILNENMDHFKKESSSNVDQVIRPFREKLSELQEKISRYREDEIKQTSSLKTEIQNVMKLNQQLAAEAQNLTKALKGDQKSQGNWGEMVLAKVLESSGLREGQEYVTQGRDLKLQDSEGQSLRPDVILKLPQEKHIIIDSKVSLIGYDRFINAENDGQRTLAQKDFLQSLRNHVSELSGKKYQSLDKLHSLDYVLMFIPIEGAFATALQLGPELFSKAWDKRVILVSPTTLMVTLRTIESIWRQEKQNKNALEIARQAGDLYDKFCGFTDDLNAIKKSLESAHKSYQAAMNKLSTGRGAIFTRFEKLKELGASASKSLTLDS